MMQKLKSITILLIGLILLVSCSSEKKEVVEFLDLIKPIMEEWSNTIELAHDTSSTDITPVMQDMDEIKRKWDALEAPAPAEKLQEKMTITMILNIWAFSAYRVGEEQTYNAFSTLANQYMIEVLTELNTLQQEYQ